MKMFDYASLFANMIPASERFWCVCSFTDVESTGTEQQVGILFNLCSGTDKFGKAVDQKELTAHKTYL